VNLEPKHQTATLSFYTKIDANAQRFRQTSSKDSYKIPRPSVSQPNYPATSFQLLSRVAVKSSARFFIALNGYLFQTMINPT
jgi:hypothetical protein